MTQVVPPPPCPHINYFHVQLLQPIGLSVFAPLVRTPAVKLRLELPTRELVQELPQALELVQGLLVSC